MQVLNRLPCCPILTYTLHGPLEIREDATNRWSKAGLLIPARIAASLAMSIMRPAGLR